jgi:hypothetical protein
MAEANLWASGAFGIIGVVVGSALTYLLTHHLQRKQWIADNRTGEFRKLISAVNESFMKIVTLSSNPPFVHNDEHQINLALAESKVSHVTASLIFIADEIGELNVMKRWTTAARKFAHVKDGLAFSNEVNDLSHDIRFSALKKAREL